MEEDVKKLLEENTAIMKEVREASLKTAQYIRWLKIVNIIKILLILIPLIIAAIYLQSLMEAFRSGYGNLLPTLLN